MQTGTERENKKMAKKLNFKQFYFKNLRVDKIQVNCYITQTRSATVHHAFLVAINDEYKGITSIISYQGRTWERFEYESVLIQLFNKFYKNKKDYNEKVFIRAQLEAIAKAEADEVKEWCDSFMKKFEYLNPEIKDRLKKSDVILENKEQADAVMNLSLVFNELMK